MIRVAVVGAGLIGSRRAQTAAASSGSQLAAVVDVSTERASEVAAQHACTFATDWRDVVGDSSIDAIVVSTVNKFLCPITVAAIEAGQHVLCEKPLGRTVDEAVRMADAARRHGKVLKVGFNLRFHPAIREAHDLCPRGEIGDLFFIRATYGHGGRPGYEAEWRADPELAGGGELLDQGAHLVDLVRWFIGDCEEVVALAPQWFWKLGPLEDNVFVQLRTASGQIASLHSSWTQWRNRFRFEVYGRNGFVEVDGLGGSYGTETLTVGRRRPESGPPDEERKVYDGPDPSWEADWADFVAAIEGGQEPEVSGRQAVATMAHIAAIYESARSGLPTPIEPPTGRTP